MNTTQRDVTRKTKYATSPIPGTVETRDGKLVPVYYGRKLYEYDDGVHAYYRLHTKNKPLLKVEIKALNKGLLDDAIRYQQQQG